MTLPLILRVSDARDQDVRLPEVDVQRVVLRGQDVLTIELVFNTNAGRLVDAIARGFSDARWILREVQLLSITDDESLEGQASRHGPLRDLVVDSADPPTITGRLDSPDFLARLRVELAARKLAPAFDWGPLLVAAHQEADQAEFQAARVGVTSREGRALREQAGRRRAFARDVEVIVAHLTS